MIFTSHLLDNFYIGEEDFISLPSLQSGIPEDIVYGNIIYGCKVIAECGIRLGVAQASIVAGQIMLWRFYSKADMVNFNVKVHALACLWLAQKMEELRAHSLKEVVLAYFDTQYRKEGRKFTYSDQYSNGFTSMRQNVEEAELVVLGKLGFCTLIDPPHKLVNAFLLWLDKENKEKRITATMSQAAWDLANLGTYTPVCLKYKSNVVASGVIYLAARQTGVKLSEDPPWWALLRVSHRDTLKVAADLLTYQQKDLASIAYESPVKWLQAQQKQEAKAQGDSPEVPAAVIPPPKLSKQPPTSTSPTPHSKLPKPKRDDDPPRAHSASSDDAREARGGKRWDGDASANRSHKRDSRGGDRDDRRREKKHRKRDRPKHSSGGDRGNSGRERGGYEGEKRRRRDDDSPEERHRKRS